MIRRTTAKTILSPTSGFIRAAGFTHSLTPARNCLFGCTYCYVPTLRVFGGLRREDWERWGQFSALKENAADLIARDLRGGERIYCSPLVDPYQPSEAASRLTSSILDAIIAAPPARKPRVFCVQTRGPLVVRDVARLVALAAGGTRARVSFSITTDPVSDGTVRRAYEPKCAPIDERLAVVRSLRGAGVETIATLAPILPCDPEALIDAVAAVTDPRTPIVADPFHAAGTKRGAVTRPQALRVSGAKGWDRWHDPSFQVEIRERLSRRAAAHGRRVEFGVAGFALLSRDQPT
jgi:DNA repair photolyase